LALAKLSCYFLAQVEIKYATFEYFP